MPASSKQIRMLKSASWGIYLTLLSLLAWRIVIQKPGLDARGVTTWIEIFFLIVLYIYINLTALGLGWFLLKFFASISLTRFETLFLEHLLGLGALSLGIAFLGFAGWLNTWLIFLWMALSGFISLQMFMRAGFPSWTLRLPRARSTYLIILQLISLAAIPLLLVESFSPVWDYDALMYHLEVPRQYLANGGIFFNPDVLRSIYPYGGEMLFLIGMAFDLDPFAKLINLTYAILFILSSYVFCRRYFGRSTAYTAAGILIGVPAFWVWSTWAAVDFAWGVYEFWSLYAVTLWLKSGKVDSSKWLALAGLMSGFALGIKYLSIPSFLIMAGIISWKSLEGKTRSAAQVVKNLLSFTCWAAAAGGAWYFHNWIVAGNPVYPLIFGGPGWDPLESLVLSDYVGSFGVGKGWVDYLLLPYNVYAYHNNFSTIGIEIVHPALWLAILFPVVWNLHRGYGILVVYAVLGFVVWVAGSQVIRFLIPLSAVLAILAAAVIETFPPLLKRFTQFALIGGFLLFNLAFQLQWLVDQSAWGYVSGRESPTEFLEEMSFGYDAIRFVHASLDKDQKIQFLWDGRGYLCDARCVPDDEQSNAVVFADGNPPPVGLAAGLRARGITHLLLSAPNASWFMAYHDPKEMHREAWKYFVEIFFPVCGWLVYSGDDGASVYEITCGES